MTSFRQIEANRRNALKSTGPSSEEGKQQSRLNAVRHGLTAETVIGTQSRAVVPEGVYLEPGVAVLLDQLSTTRTLCCCARMARRPLVASVPSAMKKPRREPGA